MGRPTKFDDSRRRAIIAAVEAGATRKVAAAAAGVSESSLYTWLSEFPEFSERVTRADVDCEMRMIEQACGPAAGPQGARWWLERRRPEEWGRRPPAIVVDQRTETIALSMEQLGDDELELLHALLRKALPAG